MEQQFEDIFKKALELKKAITSSDDYQKYLNICKQLEKNSKIQNIINKITVLQKDIVHMEELKIDITKVEKELELLKKELIAIPLYQVYLEIVKELDNINYYIENSISNTIDRYTGN